MKLITLLTLSVILSLSSCKSKKDFPTKEEVKEDINDSVDDMLSDLDEEDISQIAPIPDPERPKYNPSETRVNDLIHTKLAVKFDWGKHQLHGEATLDFKPFFYPVDSLILDAKGMEIHRVALVPSKNKFVDLPFKYDTSFIRIKLDKTYKRTEKYTVYVEYTAKPDEFEMGGSSAISGDKGLYFINSDSSEAGKPTQIWTQGETEASSRWFPTIDAPNEKTTQEIEITVNKRFKTLSNGLLEFSTDNGDGTRTDYWKQSLPHTPYLFMMAVGDFAIVKDTWKRKNGKKMEVNYYVEPKFEKYAKDIFGETPNMIQYFSDLLGVEYQWEKYSQVVVRDYVSGAMENTTATIHGEFLNKTKRELIDGNNESIIAHELFHHWFGDLVTCESWANLPLNESFANYSQYLWDEHKYGADEAAYNAFNEMETYLALTERSGAVDLIRFGYNDKEEMFDHNSYNKGGRILNMLRSYVGDDAFFSALKKYLTDNKFKSAEIEQLRLAFEETTGEDLHWFFDQWFLAKGHPDLSFSTQVDSLNHTLTVYSYQGQNTTEMPIYKIPVSIDVYTEYNNKVNVKSHTMWIENVRDSIVIVYNSAELKLVNIDAKRVLLADQDFEKTQEEYVFQYYNAPLYLDRKEALVELKNKSDEASVKVYLDALSDPFWHIRELAIRGIRKPVKKQPEAIKTALLKIIDADPKSSVRAAALGALDKYFGKKEDLSAVFEKAANDESYYVTSVAIQILSDDDLDKAYAMAKKLENEESSSIRTTVGDIYARKGVNSDKAFYLKNWTSIGGFERISFLKTYANFLEFQDNATVLEGMNVFKEIAKNGGTMWEKYFSGYQTLLKFRDHYGKQMKDLEAEIKSLEAEGGASSDIILKETEKKEAKKMYTSINDILQELKLNETNKQVLELIDSGASMEFIDEEDE